MARVFKLILLTLLVLLDVCVITPWLQSLVPAPPGTERAFWSLAIPLITSAIGAIAGKKKGNANATADAQEAGFIEGNGGFDWGAAAPYLAGGAGLLGGMLMNKGSSKKTGGTNDALSQLLAFQNQRMMAAEPLNQSLLAMASSMMPTHTKIPGSAIDQWMTKHEAANAAADPYGASRTSAYPTMRSFRPNTTMTTRTSPQNAARFTGEQYAVPRRQLY
jgi:hypothetical protein